MSTRSYLTRSSVTNKKALVPRKDLYAKPVDNRVEYQVFSSDYFSASDVKLYFGDIYVDDMISLDFSLQEQVMPIYGYNSYTYDAIARGNRIVQGQFGINFTSVGYLQEIIKNAHAIFFAIEEGKKKNIVSPSQFENMKLGDILKRLGKESFDQMADEYEKAIWGDSTDSRDLLSYMDRPYFQQGHEGFDIRVQYGAVNEAAGYIDGRFYQGRKEEAPNLTVEVINGVQLTGVSKQGISTQSAGAPILEYYSFMARDLNGVSMAQIAKQKNQGPTKMSSIPGSKVSFQDA